MKTSDKKIWWIAGVVILCLVIGVIAWRGQSSSPTGDQLSSLEATGSGRGGRGGQGGGQMAFTDKSTDAQLQALITETVDQFTQADYYDEQSGLTITYNLYLPASYEQSSQSYPLVAFVADSSLAGQDAQASLTQGYGGIIWASAAEQAKHESIVLVPTYPEVILDDHAGYTTTDYVEATKRLVDQIATDYRVDTDRLYVTGQSMGCMTWLILASRYPDYFTASLFVSGQWDVSTLDSLGSQKFFYVSSAGDPGASTGMANLEAEFDQLGVSYAAASDWDAQWSQEDFSEAYDDLISNGEVRNFVSLAAGTTLPEGAAAGTSEHMTSFDYVYKIEAIRDWLLAQTK